MLNKIDSNIDLLERQLNSRVGKHFFSSPDWRIKQVARQIAVQQNELSNPQSFIKLSKLVKEAHELLDKKPPALGTEESSTTSSTSNKPISNAYAFVTNLFKRSSPIAIKPSTSLKRLDDAISSQYNTVVSACKTAKDLISITELDTQDAILNESLQTTLNNLSKEEALKVFTQCEMPTLNKILGSNLATIANHLKHLDLPESKVRTILFQLKDLPKEKLEKLSPMVESLKQVEVFENNDILDILVQMKDPSLENLDGLCRIAMSLKQAKVVESNNILDILVQMKDAPKEKLEKLFDIAVCLKDAKLPGDKISVILLQLKDLSKKKLESLSTIAIYLKDITPPRKEIGDILLQYSELPQKSLYTTAIYLKGSKSAEEKLDDIAIETLYNLLKTQTIDCDKATSLPIDCQKKLIQQILLDISPSAEMLNWANDPSRSAITQPLLDEINSSAIMTPEDIGNILSKETLELFRENFEQLDKGVHAVYDTYKKELLSEKYDYLGLDKPNSFSKELSTQTMPGLAIMATRLMQKNQFNNLFICANHQAIQKKLIEISKDPSDQRCALLVGYSGISEMPDHKLSICIEKKNDVLNVFFLDSLESGKDVFYDKITGYLNSLPNKNWNLTTTGIQRESAWYGCEIFALQDSKNFLQDPDFTKKIVTKTIDGQTQITMLPPAFMVGTQSTKKITKYMEDRLKSLEPDEEQVRKMASLTSPQPSSVTPEIDLSNSLIGEELGGQGGPLTENRKMLTSYNKNLIDNKNQYITKKTIKYMHFVVSCLKALPKERVQAIIKQSLLV